MSLELNPKVQYGRIDSIHHGQIFDLKRVCLRLPSGLEQTVDIVEHSGAVAIASRDAEGRILVVRQFRPAAGDWLEELPAGRLEPGEDPLAAARREFEEETGFRAAEWRPIRTFLPAPGFATERIFLFEARGLSPARDDRLAADPDEELEIAWRSPAELIACPTTDAKTLIAALLPG